MFEFINDNDYDCGQAAACTLLAHYGALPADQDALAGVEERFPPDIIFGYFGSSPKRVRQILEYSFDVEQINGPLELISKLRNETPVIVMFQVSNFSGHWTVATGITGKFIHLTNWGDMPLDEFLTKWNGWIPRITGFNQRGFIHAGH